MTPLTPLSDIARCFSVKQVFLKDESANPFGTIKDRRSANIIQEASDLHVDKLALITSGNNGYSIGMAAKAAGTGIQVVCIVDRDLQKSIKDLLRETVYQVVEVNLHHRILRPEEVVAFARERDDEVIWDVTNGFEDAYAPIIKEIQAVKPTYVVVPVGSGGIFTGLATAIVHRRLPITLIGIGVEGQKKSIADKLTTPWTPYAKTMQVLEQHGHPIYRLPERVIKETYKMYQHLAVCEPSSAIVFGVFGVHAFSPKDVVVLINTGRSR